MRKRYSAIKNNCQKKDTIARGFLTLEMIAKIELPD
jgi:hypothetical protein